ncbi:MAG: ACP phosphodiesterase [Bacteroidia bacterium]|nr:ACP phosphodiesterase [Bacteroidia bacterium]
MFIKCFMNFLGHAYFSYFDDDAVLAGNVFGDFVKGNIAKTHYPEGIRNGLVYHRHLDSLCNNNDGFINIKQLTGNEYGHYRGIITDIFIDHLLAVHWHDFSAISLENFAVQCYQRIGLSSASFPERFARVFGYMVRDNWFVNNRHLSAIEDTLKRVERISGSRIILSSAVAGIEEKINLYKNYLYQFMEQMMASTGYRAHQ